MPPSSDNTSNASVLEFGCDRWPLHYACRVGNLEQAKYLVDVLQKPVNEQDAHDATPLYLAALTGHDEICRFLLERGAKCDPDSGGDAARVFYVALTPELRRMLREWSLSAASRDVFLDSLRKSFNDARFADCVYESTRETVYLHRIVLQARCPSLVDFIQTRENDLSPLCVADEHDMEAMMHLLEYLYTGMMNLRDVNMAERMKEMAATFNLGTLEEHLDAAIELHVTNEDAKFRSEISYLKQVRKDMSRMARLVSTPHAEFESVSTLGKLVEWSDVTVQCLDCTWSLNRFRVCGQSEYFDRALSGSFREAQESFLNLSNLVPTPEAWKLAIQFMYCDTFLDTPSLDVAVQVLELGFAILCPRLSTQVANIILIPAVDKDIVFDILDLARMYGFERLEDKCVEVIGLHFDELASRPELLAVLAQEAAGIVQGGDIKVIDVPIAAEIRRSIVREAGRADKKKQLDLLQRLVEEALQS